MDQVSPGINQEQALKIYRSSEEIVFLLLSVHFLSFSFLNEETFMIWTDRWVSPSAKMHSGYSGRIGNNKPLVVSYYLEIKNSTISLDCIWNLLISNNKFQNVMIYWWKIHIFTSLESFSPFVVKSKSTC